MLSFPATARGQLATPRQGLSFGSLIPGVSDRVTLQDAPRRAEITLSPGSSNATVGVRFIVPSSMVQSATGAQLPLAFGPGDGGIFDPGTGKLTVFDPQAGTTVRLKNKPVTIYLAGTANPAAAQRAGPYSATVTLLITNPAL